MCDDTKRIMDIVQTVKYVEKKLRCKLLYPEMQVLVGAAQAGTEFELDFQRFKVLR
jgi:hypothetical protein